MAEVGEGAGALDGRPGSDYLTRLEAETMETGRFEDIRRSSPEKVKEHERWAPYAVDGATLVELRQLVGKTQEEVGRAMGVTGVEVGRFEKRRDVQVSTVRRYLAALGGELDTFARFGEKIVPLRLALVGHNRWEDVKRERRAVPAAAKSARRPSPKRKA